MPRRRSRPSIRSARRRQPLSASLAEDKTFLTQLKALGKPHGATGKVEDVAGGLKDLMEETLETAVVEGADSDFYEAHAVLLNIKRKQMDSAGGMLEIARATKDTDLRKAATEFGKAQKASCQLLADELADIRRQDRDGQGRLNPALRAQGGIAMTTERDPEH